MDTYFPRCWKGKRARRSVGKCFAMTPHTTLKWRENSLKFRDGQWEGPLCLPWKAVKWGLFTPRQLIERLGSAALNPCFSSWHLHAMSNAHAQVHYQCSQVQNSYLNDRKAVETNKPLTEQPYFNVRLRLLETHSFFKASLLWVIGSGDFITAWLSPFFLTTKIWLLKEPLPASLLTLIHSVVPYPHLATGWSLGFFCFVLFSLPDLIKETQNWLSTWGHYMSLKVVARFIWINK